MVRGPSVTDLDLGHVLLLRPELYEDPLLMEMHQLLPLLDGATTWFVGPCLQSGRVTPSPLSLTGAMIGDDFPAMVVVTIMRASSSWATWAASVFGLLGHSRPQWLFLK
jgi:hypothetical protein